MFIYLFSSGFPGFLPDGFTSAVVNVTTDEVLLLMNKNQIHPSRLDGTGDFSDRRCR